MRLERAVFWSYSRRRAMRQATVEAGGREARHAPFPRAGHRPMPHPSPLSCRPPVVRPTNHSGGDQTLIWEISPSGALCGLLLVWPGRTLE